MRWVEAPRSLVDIFTLRPECGRAPEAPIAKVAAALGFKDEDSFSRLVALWWPAWDRQRQERVSPAELVALVHMLQFKTASAAKLAKDLMEGGAVKVVSLPTEALRGLPEEDPASDRLEEEMI